MQPHQHRHGQVREVEGQLSGVVAAIEDKQRQGLAGGQPCQQRPDLRGGGLVGVLQRVQAAGIHRGGPRVTVEADLRDPLEGPAGDDRLTRGVTGGMVVVVATLRGAFSVAAWPGGYVHGEDRRVGGRHHAHQQVAQPLGIDLTAGQGGVDAAPAALDGFKAQVRQRRDRLGAQQRIAAFEQRIGAAGEAGVQLSPERTEPREGEG